MYLNNAGTSWPKAPGVIEAVTEALGAGPAATTPALHDAQRLTCELIGADDPSRVLLTPGCTSALALAIGDLDWQPGDAIVTSSLEHHALARPVEKLVRERGVVHRVVGRAPDGPLCLATAGQALADRTVRWVAVTHASNVTGELLPVVELAQLAHAHGARMLLDAAQTLAVVPIDVGSMGIDMLTFAGHKGPLAPQGVGGLWAAQSVEFSSPAAVCQVTARPTGVAPSAGCSSFPGYCDVGSVNGPAVAGLVAALRWQLAHGARGWQRARDLAMELRAALSALPHCEIYGAAGPCTATLSLRVHGLDMADAEAEFARSGLTVRAGQHCAPMALDALGAHEGTVRISFGPWSTSEQVGHVVRAVASMGSGRP